MDTKLSRRGLLIVSLALLFLAAAGGFRYASYLQTPTTEEGEIEQVSVHIVGAVKHPGLYTFRADARTQDAVNEAVPEEGADLNAMNLAAFLLDGSRISVPWQPGCEPQDEEQAKAVGRGESGLININAADAELLMTLNGIGPAKAQAIIDYRETYGPFASVDNLIEVSGFGPATLANLRNYICAE